MVHLPRTLAAALLAALATLAALPAAADAAYLARLLADMESVSAEFSQTVGNRFGDVLQQSTGRMHVARPDKLRWEVDEPYPQLVVADGQSIWVFDPDLAQATVQPMDAAARDAAAVLLAGSAEELLRHFNVRAAEPPPNGGARFVLIPLAEDALFRELALTFAVGGALAGIDIGDHLDQFTRIVFSDVQRGAVLDSALFRFEVPPGVDVIGDLPTAAPER